jgi:hypothetical protein
MFSSIFRFMAVFFAFFALASVSQAAPSRLSKRDFFCDTKDVHCCDQLMTGKEATQALGNLLALPSSLLGQNVGLGCAVRLLLPLRQSREC